MRAMSCYHRSPTLLLLIRLLRLQLLRLLLLLQTPMVTRFLLTRFHRRIRYYYLWNNHPYLLM